MSFLVYFARLGLNNVPLINLYIFLETEVQYIGNATKRLSWSKDEIDAVEKQARFFIENCEPPPLEMCAAIRDESSVLKRRSAETIKAFISNQIKKRKMSLITPEKKTCRKSKAVHSNLTFFFAMLLIKLQ